MPGASDREAADRGPLGRPDRRGGNGVFVRRAREVPRRRSESGAGQRRCSGSSACRRRPTTSARCRPSRPSHNPALQCASLPHLWRSSCAVRSSAWVLFAALAASVPCRHRRGSGRQTQRQARAVGDRHDDGGHGPGEPRKICITAVPSSRPARSTTRAGPGVQAYRDELDRDVDGRHRNVREKGRPGRDRHAGSSTFRS